MNEINKAAKDIGDTVKEGVHRGQADSERAKREAAGDAMTPGDKAGSVIDEAGSTAKAEIDRTKRTFRDST
ncbi:MAG: hypothetical protein ABR508_07105 [Candidatus Baltobacteraceae bacterium]